MMGLELCFGLLSGLVRDQKVSLARLVDAMSTRPARIAGLDAPTLRVGARASFVLADPTYRWVPAKTPLQTKSRNTPFLQKEITGRVLLTVADGKVVFDSRI
jgi:dihydroorotase